MYEISLDFVGHVLEEMCLMLMESGVNLAPQIKCLIFKKLRVKLAPLALWQLTLEHVGHVLEEVCLMLKKLRVNLAPQIKCLIFKKLRVKLAPLAR
jgi:hypothetical protein